MPLIHKRRIWWEPVAGAIEYVVYVSLAEQPINPALFSWEETPSMISKLVVAKTELIIPDEWPEFPAQAGTYHIAVTSRNEVGNQSDPLIFAGVFNFIAPCTPARGGIESVVVVQPEVKPLMRPSFSENVTLIQRGVREAADHQPTGHMNPVNPVANTYLMGNHLRNSDSQG